jgi:hypothetical protein
VSPQSQQQRRRRRQREHRPARGGLDAWGKSRGTAMGARGRGKGCGTGESRRRRGVDWSGVGGSASAVSSAAHRRVILGFSNRCWGDKPYDSAD